MVLFPTLAVIVTGSLLSTPALAVNVNVPLAAPAGSDLISFS